MTAARGFRAVHDDATAFYVLSDEDPSIVTEVDPDTPISPPGGIYVHANPYKPAADMAVQMTFTNPDRLLLVEYDTTSVTATGKASRPWLTSEPTERVGDTWTYTSTGQPLYSVAWAKISTGTIVDELTAGEIGLVAASFAESQLASVQAILAAHGWAGWQPARV